MNFVYNNNALDNNKFTKIMDNNKENIKEIRKNFCVIIIDNKLYFVKTINKKCPLTPIINLSNDKEIDPTNQVANFLLTNQKFAPLFVNIYSISQNEHYDYYIMDYIKYGDFSNVLPILNTKWKFSLLMQSLLSIYILNHKIKLFHNDLYYNGVVRNIMVDHVETPYSINQSLNNVIITINVRKFCTKMIDFGRCSNKQAFRTTEYHNKHFSQIKYISEPLLFTYFFFKTFGFEEFNMLNQMGSEISKNSSTLIDFDSKFLIKIYNKFKKYIM